jgi:hypothetical protein
MGDFGVVRWQLSKHVIISLAPDEVDGCQSSDEADDYELGCLRACRTMRAGSMSKVRPRRRIDGSNAIAPGDNSHYPHCRFRQTVALPSLRQSKCPCDAQACYLAAKGFLIRGADWTFPEKQ